MTQQIEIEIKAMNAGILPAFHSHMIDDLFSTLDKETSRAMKRKFRKLWRKARDKKISSAASSTEKEFIRQNFESPTVRRDAVLQMIRNNEF